MRHIGLIVYNNTLAPQTNEKWILGSHDFIANARLGSSSANGGSFADGCGLLPELNGNTPNIDTYAYPPTT